jgi:hypothetical protein
MRKRDFIHVLALLGKLFLKCTDGVVLTLLDDYVTCCCLVIDDYVTCCCLVI